MSTGARDWNDEIDRAVDALAKGESAALPEAAGDEEGKRVVAGLRALQGALAATPDELALVAGDAIPRPVLPDDYQVIEEIGRGGMGVVYRAKRLSDGQVVAIKVLHPAQSLFGESIRRFRREAATLARLEHPNIVKMHEVAEHQGQLYLVMEHVEGRPLDDVLAETGALSPARATKVLQQVARAVAHVHQHGIVHRDLKPANVLVDARDHVYVTDFGLAFEIGGETGLTLTGQVLGTPAYMSPEQARGQGEAVDKRSDVYAMGVILYECLTGRRPFAGLSPPEQVYAAIHRTPHPPRSLRRGIPRDLQTICQKAMQKRKALRYPSAKALLKDLEAAAAGRPIHARPPSRAYRLGRFVRRHRASLAWGAALVALAVTSWIVHRTRTARSSGDLLRAADSLRDGGRHDDALRAYQDAWDQDDDVKVRAVQGLVDTHVRKARALWTRDRRSEARASLMQARDAARLAEAPTVAVAWTAAVFDAFGSGDLDAVLADRQHPALVRMRRALAAWEDHTEERARRRWRAGGPSPSQPQFEAYRELIGLLREPVDDPTTPAGRAAVQELRCLYAAADQPFFVRETIHPLLAHDGGGYLEATIRAAVPPHAPLPTHTLAMLVDQLAQRAMTRPRRVRRIADALAQIAAREDPLPVRRAAAVMLARWCNLPFAGAFSHDEFHKEPIDPGAVVAAWRRIRSLPAEEALDARVHIAMASLDTATDAGRAPFGFGLVNWCHRTLGLPTSHVAIAQWWAANQDAPARSWLRDALALPDTTSWGDARRLISLWVREDNDAYETLLVMLAPSEFSVPHVRLRGDRDRKARLAAWRRGLHGVRALRARVGHVEFTNGRWRVDPGKEMFVPFPVAPTPSQTVAIERTFAVPARLLSSLDLAWPGPPATRSEPLEQTILGRLVFEGVSPRFAIASRSHSAMRTAGSEDTSGQGFSTDFVLSPDLDVRSWHRPDWFRRQFSLMAFEPSDAPAGPVWTLARWRAALVQTLQRLAAGVTPEPPDQETYAVRRFALDHQVDLLFAGAIATRIPLPEAQDALRALAQAPTMKTLRKQGQVFEVARLFAGDESALDAMQFPEPTTLADKAIGWKGEAAVRLLELTRSERIRAFALAHIQAAGLSGVAAGDLRDAVRAGRVSVPPWLAQRLEEGPTERRSWWEQLRVRPLYLVVLCVVLLYTVLTLALLLWPGRGSAARLVPAAWAVVVGFAIACVQMIVAGVDTVPNSLGFALSALGAWILARAANARPWAAGLFAAMAVIGVVMRSLSDETTYRVFGVLQSALLVLAITFIARLAIRLRGVEPGARDRLPRAFLFVYTFPMLIWHAWIVFALATGRDPNVTLDSMALGVIAGAWGIGILLCMLYPLVRLVEAARVRRAWRRLRNPADAPQPA